MVQKSFKNFFFILMILALAFGFSLADSSEDILTPQELLQLKMVRSALVSPDGRYIAYTLRVPRAADDEPGAAYSELYVYRLKDKQTIPFITGKVQVYGLQWRPDSKALTFIDKREGDDFRQIYQIRLDGGEAQPITDVKVNISRYVWHPSGKFLLLSATEPPNKKEKFLKKKATILSFTKKNGNTSIFIVTIWKVKS